MRILVVEDNASLTAAISRALGREGHFIEVLDDGVDADEYLSVSSADLVVLDINLPRLSGLDILRRLRRRGDATPVVILTARSEPKQRVLGLDAGADDYMVKPFEMDELLARVRALSRRRPSLSPLIEKLGALEYDRGAQSFSCNDVVLNLPPRERALLDLLFNDAGKVVSKLRLSESLYGVGSDVDSNAIELAVSRLRKRLGEETSIRTVRGLGYMLEVPPKK